MNLIAKNHQKLCIDLIKIGKSAKNWSKIAKNVEKLEKIDLKHEKKIVEK